jgi:TRAP-type C4-dicarboxylate transport system permease small subunit
VPPALAFARRLILGFDRLLGRIEAVALAAMVAAITAVTFLQVFTRYVTGNPLIWTEELARYLFVWITLVGGAAAVRTRGHFGLDILRRFAPPLRVPLGAMSMLIVFAFLGMLFYTGILETVQASTQISHAIGVNMHWAYLSIPIGAGLALWHVIAHWAESGIGAHPLDPRAGGRTDEERVTAAEEAT